MDIYKKLLEDESRHAEFVTSIFRWILYSLVFILASVVFFAQKSQAGLYGIIFSFFALLLNGLFTFFIKKKLFLSWIRYLSAIVDVLGLSTYNASDAYINSPLASITTATLLIYPVLIFLAALRLDRKLIIFTTLLSVISMDSIYFISYPHFDQSIAKELVSADLPGQIYRTMYILLCGFLMLFIPRTVERLLKKQKDIYETSIDNYELAHKDKLTGIGNRALLEEKLINIHDYSVKNNQKYAIIYIDLDGFKQVNDLFGHDIGDQVLVKISQNILEETRDIDKVCRIGGDEFVIIVEKVMNIATYINICNRLIDSISSPMSEFGVNITLGASIGIAIYPDNGNSYKDILIAADEAMYRAKKTGKNKVVFY